MASPFVLPPVASVVLLPVGPPMAPVVLPILPVELELAVPLMVSPWLPVVPPMLSIDSVDGEVVEVEVLLPALVPPVPVRLFRPRFDDLAGGVAAEMTLEWVVA